MKKGWKTFVLILVAIASSITVFGTVKGLVQDYKDKNTNETASESTAQVMIVDSLVA